MTLNEGLRCLMTSDAANNGLIHETWTDKFIQVSFETYNKGNISGIIDTTKPRIKVISTFGDGDYAEDKFERKNLKDIKDSGWLIVGPEYLAKMYTKVLRNKKVDEVVKPKPENIEIEPENVSPSNFFDYDYSTKTAAIIEPEYLMYQGKCRPRGADVYLSLVLFNKTNDYSDNTDLKDIADFVIKSTRECNDVIMDDDCIDITITKAGNTDVILHQREIILAMFKSVSVSGCDETLYKKYKRLIGFGLNSEDIKAFEAIITENNISIPLDYLKDLDSFERNAAVEMVNKLIASYMKNKK